MALHMTVDGIDRSPLDDGAAVSRTNVGISVAIGEPADGLLRPEPSRVVLRPFVPTETVAARNVPSASRQERVVARILALSDDDLCLELQTVERELADRHRDVPQILERRYNEISRPGAPMMRSERKRLIGAYFTEEYAFEAAALFNPSIVIHPDQSGVPAGAMRFVMSLRSIGEGHISSISFRTGTVSGAGDVQVDPPSLDAASPHIENIPGGAADDPGVRLSFVDLTDLSQIVIFPTTYRQRHGLEDVRLVRFVDDNDEVRYLGTYTAFSGEAIRQEILSTHDFQTFELSAIRGPASEGKGMALFPRRIDGRFAMLGRQDHETISLMLSNDLYNWSDGVSVIAPQWAWEFVQMGNCGSPLEIDEGWLVITHGVGAVRSYALGACLLDKGDPSKLLMRLRDPMVWPSPSQRSGYVPNVVYSCGALVHDRTLLLPYGVADSFTAFANISIDRLLGAMKPV